MSRERIRQTNTLERGSSRGFPGVGPRWSGEDWSIDEAAEWQQQEPVQAVPGGVDFSQATRTEDGRLCVIKEETIETLAKEPVLECVHNNVEKCHYTYITQFEPTQEEECSENFQKNCQITFRFVIVMR